MLLTAKWRYGELFLEQATADVVLVAVGTMLVTPDLK